MRILSLALCICIYVSALGQKPSKSYDTPTKCVVSADSYVPGEWIFWSPEQGVLKPFYDSLNEVLKYKGITKRKQCPSCDEDIWILSGDSLENFIRAHGPGYSKGAGSLAASGGGDNNRVYFSRNFIIQIPHNELLKAPSGGFKLLNNNGIVPQGRIVEVAVFDTGIDSIQHSLYSTTNSSRICNEDDARGWNFVDSNSNITDNHSGYHGSWVTQLIIDQVVKKNNTLYDSGKIVLKILPVKVLDSNGRGNLFNLLCGFAYARKAGIKIFNASLGFYFYCNPAPEMLTKQVEKLRNEKILLITAAGNMDKNENEIAKSYGVPEEYLRNLDYHHFYPAGLSNHLNNVICVTTTGYSRTISKSKSRNPGRIIPSDRMDLELTADPSSLVVSPSQNYSSSIVNVAVKSDFKFLRYAFLYRLHSEYIILEGSSFATPIFTGKLISSVLFSPTHYDGRVSFDGTYRRSILNAMLRDGDLQIMDRLREQVQEGRMIKR